MHSQVILNSLSSSGFRISKVRKNLVEYLASCQKPHSVPELLTTLKPRMQTLNKTSLYRELSFLKDQGIVQEIEFGEGKKRYEINDKHHHHVVCTQCDRVEDIPFDNEVLEHEKRIEKNMSFRLMSHSLEFFGVCRSCQH